MRTERHIVVPAASAVATTVRGPGHGAAADDDYRVASAAERLALLQQLRDSSAPVLLHAPGGGSLRTTLWVVDGAAGRLAFAVARSELSAPQIDQLLEPDEVTAIGHPGDVKLQFELHGLVVVRGASSAVLQSALPEQMLRFQRRETYRVCPPVAAPVAYLRHPSIPDMSLALRVLDVSSGGCALRLPDDVPTLAPGTRIAGVTIELDVNTRLRVDLTLLHLTQLGITQEGAHGEEGSGPVKCSARLGCEWHLGRPDDARALQRWIDQAQRRQRLK